MGRGKIWIPMISWGPFQLQDATKEHCICTYICPCFFIKTYMDVWLYINVYCIHTFKHKALVMRTAEEMQKPMRGFAALDGTRRCHWQNGARPPALLPLQSPLKPTGSSLCGCNRCKAPNQDCRVLSLVTPVTSVPDLRRQARTKVMKGKAQTLHPGTQLCPRPMSGGAASFSSSPSP